MSKCVLYVWVHVYLAGSGNGGSDNGVVASSGGGRTLDGESAVDDAVTNISANNKEDMVSDPSSLSQGNCPLKKSWKFIPAQKEEK